MDHNTIHEKDWTKQLGDPLETDNLTTRTVDIDLFGGTTASYHHTPWPPNPSNPTLVMISGFATTVDIFCHQLTNPELSQRINMLAIEPLGHGKTRTNRSDFTYWDSAVMTLAILDAFNLTEKVFVTGISQGGWMAVHLALLAPERVAGLIPMDTSMDSESPRSRELGCWDAHAELSPFIKKWSHPYAYRLFEPDSEFIEGQVTSGFGSKCSLEDHDYWSLTMRKNWSGEEGRKRALRSAINLRDHDSLHGRLAEVKCPVLWLHGDADSNYSVELAKEEIEKFVNSTDKRLEILEGGTHFITWSKREEVSERLLGFVKRYGAYGEQSTP